VRNKYKNPKPEEAEEEEEATSCCLIVPVINRDAIGG